jgi:uncharacterized protein YjiS (DUF1127 family)
MTTRTHAAKAARNTAPRAAANEDLKQESGNVVNLHRRHRIHAPAGIQTELSPPLLVTDSLFLRLADRLLSWIERSRQRRQLGALSDNMLKDIGLSRADVDYESRKGFWRG